MLPEQQQRILGYFIEEAKEHLTTIEQGLLNLQSTLNDPETLNEVFRAAHSVKGGAAMLGLSSIQHTAHRLEDCFKILKEEPVEVDQKLETLFLNVSDTLKALLEKLQGPFGLTEEVANNLMSEAEPYFQSLHDHLDSLVKQGGNGESGDTSSSYGVNTNSNQQTVAASAVSASYGRQQLQTQVLKTLRQMLQLFKQTATSENRQELESCCQHLAELGEELDFINWSALCLTAKTAIANSENSYLVLAKVVITSIKQALELVIADKETEIVPSEQLEALIGLPDIEFFELAALQEEEDNTSLAAISQITTSSDRIENELIDASIPEVENVEPQDNIHNLSELFDREDDNQNIDDLFSNDENLYADGPQVGSSELITLAHLFADDNSDLDENWQQEEVFDFGTNDAHLNLNLNNGDTEENDSELADLLSLDTPDSNGVNSLDRLTEELTLVQLFGENLLDDDHLFSTGKALDIGNNVNLDIHNIDVDQSTDDDNLLAENTEDFIEEVSSLNNDELLNIETKSVIPSWEQIADNVDSNFSNLFPDENTTDNNLLTDDRSLTVKTELINDNQSSLETLFLPTPDSEEVAEPEDIAKSLEDSLFAAAESGEIFGEYKDNQLDINHELSEFESTIFQEFASEDNQLDINHELSEFESTIFQEFASEDNSLDFSINDELSEFESTIFQEFAPEDNSLKLSASASNEESVVFSEFTSEDNSPELNINDEESLVFSEFTSEDNSPELNINDEESLVFSEFTSEDNSLELNINDEAPEDNSLELSINDEESLVFSEFTSEDNSLELSINDEAPEDNSLELSINDEESVAFSEFAPEENSLELSINDEESLVFSEFTSEDNSLELNINDEAPEDNSLELNINDEASEDNSLELSINDEESLVFSEFAPEENSLELSINDEESVAFPEFAPEENSLELSINDEESVAFPEFAPEDNSLELSINDEASEDNSLELSINGEESVAFTEFASEDNSLELSTNGEESVAFQEFSLDSTNNNINVSSQVDEVSSTHQITTEKTLADEEAKIDLINEDGNVSSDNIVPKVIEEETLNINESVTNDATDEIIEFSSLSVPTSTTEAIEKLVSDLPEITNDRVVDNFTITDNNDSADLESLISEESVNTNSDNEDAEFADLESLISEESVNTNSDNGDAEFADLEFLINEETVTANSDNGDLRFADLEALLDVDIPEETNQRASETSVGNYTSQPVIDDTFTDGFKDLEEMLKGSLPLKTAESSKRNSGSRISRFEQLMKVPVKHLDDMSNLVGELVVNRNSLEQDQDRLRQSLDNLLNQVQQLSDVGARMQELYEHSLLEASLLASRRSSSSGSSSVQESDRGLTELEIDRFTPFHSLSQEMIELIVRVRESSSDIDFVIEETEQVVRQFRQVTTQLQEGLTRSRMEPFSVATDILPRGVRDNAIKSGKQVKLDIQGRDTLIDKMILEHLGNPLNHLLNNAIAHGIETPQERIAAGKPETGTINVAAFHQGNQTVISVSDDGAGINPEKVKEKALKMGLISPQEAQNLSINDTYELLFHPGFSTKDQADMLGGRGVGMDVVRTKIGEIRGAINVDSIVGKGSDFTIRLPLTLSICKALFCVSDRARIAFPMDSVEDTLDVHPKHVQYSTDGQAFITWHDTKLPFKPLKDLLSFNRQLSRGNVYGANREDEMISAIIVRSANNFLALEVDQVLNEQEIAIKQFEGPAPKPIGVAGATILGDGRIMPIADVLEIMDIFQGRTSKQAGVSSFWEQNSPPIELKASEGKSDPTVLIVDDSITVRELLSLTFNKAGYRVEQARDGQEAWDKLRSGLPCDLVFCDIEMPRCDGLELLSRIQKDPELQKLPIAMLTSRGADKHRQMAIQLGASGYFTKPYLEEALLEAASRMLKGEKLVVTS